MRNSNKSTTRTLLAGLSLLAGFVALTTRADYPSTVLGLNPVGYWRLSESVSPPAPNLITNYGSLGAAGNGYPYPGTELTFAQPGVVGTCINFTNITGGGNAVDAGDVIDVPNNPALNPNGPFTIEFWAKPSAKTGDLLAPISSLTTVPPGSPPRYGYLVYHDTGGDGGDHRWEFRIGGSVSYCYNVRTANGTGPAGVWTHVVCVYDGTFASVYINGALSAGPQSIIAGRNFQPNQYDNFRIGGTTAFGRMYDGALEQVAFYGSALDANSISNHYYVGTNNPAGYSAAVLANSPAGYWPLNEPVYTPPDPSTLPVTANIGTLGTAANGTNQPGLTAGVAGPPFAGFPPINLGSRLSFLAGNVALGNPDGLNFAGPITLMAWVKPTYTGGLRNILSHGYRTTPDQEVQLRINGGDYEVGSWSPGEGTNSAAAYPGQATKDIGNWVFLAGTYDGANWNLYRYGQLIAGPSPGTSGALLMDVPWSIGSRGDTSSDGRFLGGWIDEVAIFTNALSAAQIQSIFLAAKMSPVIIVAPVPPAGTVYEGVNLSFSVEAAGNPTLLYQWTKNGAPLPGQNGTTLTLNNVTTGTSGAYAIVVTNNYGSITSSFPVTVISGPPLITQQPQSATRYVGASASFAVGAVGSPTITYQWYFNTNTQIGGATSSNYSKANVQLADAGKYNCRLTNGYGSSNSAYATLTVLPVPATPYPPVILADNPVAYFRLGESSGTVAHDSWGGHDGSYNGGVLLGQPGFSPLDPDTAAGFGAEGRYVGTIGGIDFSGTSSAFSLEAWVKGPANQVTGSDANATIIGKGRGGNGAGGINGWQFVLDVSGGKYRLLVEPASGAGGSAVADVGPNDTWQHVVATYDQVGGSMAIYVNGMLAGSGSPPAAGPLAIASPVTIGAGQGGVSPAYDMYFNGSIDEVAIYNTALSPSQVLAHYCGQYGPSQPPLIARQPSSVTQWVGWPLTLSVSAAGSCEVTYQWKKGSTPLTDGGTITGSQSNRLDISALDLLDAGNYSVIVSNSVGTSNSAVAVVNVLATPTNAIPVSGLVMHLKFENNLLDSTGRGNNGTAHGAISFVSGTNGQALHYYTDTAASSSNYVSLGVRPDLQFSSNVNFSVAYWVRLPLNAIPGDLPIFCSAVGSTFSPGYTFAPSYKLGGWAWSLNGTGVYGANNSINDGNFNHLVHTFDRQGNGITYLNGVQVDSRSVAGVGNIDTGQSANIGQDPTGTYSETGEADIDDLGVWRRALTAVEARGLYVAATNGFSFVDISPAIKTGPGAGQITVTWQAGILQSAISVAGPYSDVPGATSPYAVTPTGATFYRTRY